MSTNNSNLTLEQKYSFFDNTGQACEHVDVGGNFSLVETSQKGAVYQLRNGNSIYRVVIGRTPTKENGSKWPTTRTAIRVERQELGASADTPIKLTSHATLVVSAPDLSGTEMPTASAMRESVVQLLLAVIQDNTGAEPMNGVYEIAAGRVSQLSRVLDGGN